MNTGLSKATDNRGGTGGFLCPLGALPDCKPHPTEEGPCLQESWSEGICRNLSGRCSRSLPQPIPHLACLQLLA